MAGATQQKVGNIQVTALTDGTGQFGYTQFPSTDPALIDKLVADAGHKAILTNFNVFLIRSGGQLILVDTGCRELFGPTAGKLPQELAREGISPDQIDKIFLTHLHPDHIAGAITQAGAAVFENAELVVAEAERAFWSDAGNFAAAGPDAQKFQQLAMSVLAAYAGHLTTFDGETDIGGGLITLPLPGHTAGHAGLRISDGAAQMVIAGDIVHAQTLQLARPEIAVVYDSDADRAAKSRAAMLDMLAQDNIVFSGGHFQYPAIGRVSRYQGGYKLVDS